MSQLWTSLSRVCGCTFQNDYIPPVTFENECLDTELFIERACGQEDAAVCACLLVRNITSMC